MRHENPFRFSSLTFAAKLHDRRTVNAIVVALAITDSALTCGEEIYFGIAVKVSCERDARTVIALSAITYWFDETSFSRRPISADDETRLAGPCNIWANTLSDVKTFAKVRGGTKI
jgi:uncharacterized protein